jgi:hypothetical protein
MSAKIYITVDYENIPSEVNVILERPINALSGIMKSLEAAKRIEDPQEKLKVLDGLRKRLITVDLNIEDAYQILLSYTKSELERMKDSNGGSGENG